MKSTILLFTFLSYAIPNIGQTITKEKIARLEALAKATNSYSLILIKDNTVLVEEYFGKKQTPVYLSSVSKALVSIGIIKLLSDGKITSLNQPVAEFFPEWKQGNKKNITIKMLLNHTSGLQNEANASLELEPPPNWKVKNVISLALAAELSARPGEVMTYNNKAVALLGGVIEKASGKRMDTYFEEEFFKPMDIISYDWIKDESGNPTAHGAFVLQGRDLAKFGELMVNKGKYNGKQFFDEKWIDSSFLASQSLDERLGLLWWGYSKDSKRIIDKEQINKLKAAHLDSGINNKMEPLFFKIFNSRDDYFAAIQNIFGKDWQGRGDSIFRGKAIDFYSLPKVTMDKPLGYYHTGYGGNYLVIIPDINLVVVRLIKKDENYNYSKDSFHNFIEEVFKLIYE